MSTAIKRVILVIMDSVGIGELPDAADYGDVGSNTLGNIARVRGGLKLPNLGALGIGRLTEIQGVPPEKPRGTIGRMMIDSPGKDTMTGHWELAGIVLDHPIRTYPQGFPAPVIEKFEQAIGRKILGNKVASGTEIIAELGPEHIRTGRPIVYTSADSVFQIAAHEEVIPVDELYRMCEIARGILVGEDTVGRVIARPFVGEPGKFTRTERRRDYTLKPPRKMLLDFIKESGYPVIAIGKIEDIYAGQGITRAVHTKNNGAGIDAVKAMMMSEERGLIFGNLVDFDMLYGHRNDVPGYAAALEELDQRLPEIIDLIREEDVLILTADHGCDPTTPSTDHSREYVPLLVYGPRIEPGVDVGIRRTLADLGATIAALLGGAYDGPGESFAGQVLADRT